MTAARRPVVVLVCGEPQRGDDAAALVAIERLPREVRVGVEIRPIGCLELEEIVAVEAGAACLVVDAAIGPAPGEVVKGTLESLAHPLRGVAAPRSTHAMAADQVLGLAALVRPGLPPGSFLGIGGASFGLGHGLSPAVERAIPRLVEAISTEIERLATE